MIVASDVQALLEKIDRQIIQLLDERLQICSELIEQGRGSDLRAEAENMLSLWLEEAADRDLDEATVERVCKLVVGMCLKEKE